MTTMATFHTIGLKLARKLCCCSLTTQRTFLVASKPSCTFEPCWIGAVALSSVIGVDMTSVVSLVCLCEMENGFHMTMFALAFVIGVDMTSVASLDCLCGLVLS